MSVSTVGLVYERMRREAPVSSSSFLDEHNFDGIDLEKPMFRDWCGMEDGIPLANRADTDAVEIDDGHRFGYCSQWSYWTMRGEKLTKVIVNLPGMELSIVSGGEPFTVGKDRVYADTPKDTLDSQIESGYRLLMESVKKMNEL